MDLSFSPDLPAWACYIVVFAFGALTGWREVVEKLAATEGVWKYRPTWGLMLLLAISPVFLFWVLDRSGAVNDTSLLAAVIIGLAYTQILKGETGYKAPGSTSPIWDFIGWARQRIGRSLQNKSDSNVLAFDNKVCECLADPAKLPEAQKLAQRLAPDPVAFTTALEAERQRLTAANPPLDQTVINFKLAEILYREMAGDPNGRKLMVANNLIDSKLVKDHFSAPWPDYIVGAVMILIALGIGASVSIDTTRGVSVGDIIERGYMNVRLQKSASTPTDLARVTGGLMKRINSAADTNKARFWLEPFRETLRNPTLPMPRLDATLLVLLSARESGKLTTTELAETLVYALRNNNVDARRRIQTALIYLAKLPPQPVVDAELVKWNPTDGDSVPQVEEYIDRWRAHWSPRPTNTAVKPG